MVWLQATWSISTCLHALRYVLRCHGLFKTTCIPGLFQVLVQQKSLLHTFKCKNEAQTNFLPNVDQAMGDSFKGNFHKNKWALITRDPRYAEFERVYVTVDLWEFLELLKKNKEPLTKEPDREFAYKLSRLKQVTSDVLKHLTQ
jgi:hypothetical protein